MRAFIKSLVQGSPSKPSPSEPSILPKRILTSSSAKEKARSKMSKVKDATKRKLFGSPPQAGGIRPFTLQRDGINHDANVGQTDWDGFVSNVSEPLKQIQLLSDGTSFFYRRCRGCKASLPLNISFDSEFEGYCNKCRTWTCGGCGKSKGKKDSGGIAPACCDAGRLFRLWVALGKFDKTHVEDLENSRAATLMISNNPGPRKSGGIGYGSRRDMHNPSEDVNTFKATGETDYDATTSQIIDLISRELMPGPRKTTAFDMLALNLLQYSLFFDSIVSLIRNDSVDNITERRTLYEKLFSLLELLASQDELCKSLVCLRPNLKNSPGLWKLHGKWSPTDDVEKSLPPILSFFENTYKQARTFIGLAEKHFGVGNKGRGKWKVEQAASKSLCETIVEIYETCERQQQMLNLETAPLKEKDSMDIWRKFMKDNKVTFSDDVLKFHRHVDKFSNPKVNATGASGRNNTISKEIANMATSLPDNIFLKVAEQRSDVMKVLIVGVQGTPYEGGLFPFDIYLDSQYPRSPPKMTFSLDKVDDEGDGFPINPNLHVGSGTVCLSILNTWDGDASQKWQPNKSTLLSVLVSVQAMILGAPCPYLNEPGREKHDINSTQVVADTKRTQTKVVIRGIIPWLEKLKTPVQNNKDAIWDETSAMYWKYHAHAVQDVVTEWAATNPSLNNYTTHYTKDYKPLSTLKSLVKWVEENSDNLGVLKPEALAEIESVTKKRKRESSGASDGQAMKKKWQYTGGRSLKEVRIACSEVGVKSARSLKESIERLEEALNGESVSSEHMELAKKWGALHDA